MKALNNKYVKYGSVIVIISAIGYLIYNKQKKKKEIKKISDIINGVIADPSTGGAQKVITKAQAAALPDGTFPLKFKDKNKKVLALQQALNRKYGTAIDLDGTFGISTANALCKYYFTFCKSGLSDRLTVQAVGNISNEDYNKILK